MNRVIEDNNPSSERSGRFVIKRYIINKERSKGATDTEIFMPFCERDAS